MDVHDLIQSIDTLLSEAYAGPADPSSTWFVDNAPEAGILGVVAKVTAHEASWSSNPGQPGTTIAANVEHLRWSLANANGILHGEPFQGSWRESWNTLDIDEAAWDSLRQALRSEFEALLVNLGQQTDLPGIYLNGVLALIPHAAYHLGSIRQLIERALEHDKS